MSRCDFPHPVSSSVFITRNSSQNRHSLAGLQPDTNYKVSIKAKNLKAASTVAVSGHNLQQLSSSIELRTAPQGLPEPPVDVQADVREGGREIVVTWLPVTINPAGTSNGAPVTGYVVYADGRNIKVVDSGTADQATVAVDGRMSVKNITMRTKSGDKLSKESDPCPVNIRTGGGGLGGGAHNNEEDSESEAELIERLAPGTAGTNLARSGLAKPREMLLNYSGYPELDSDIGPSELSDIAEEPEEGLTDDSGDDQGNGSRAPPSVIAAGGPSYDRASLYKANGNALSQWPSKAPSSGAPKASPSISSADKFGTLGSSQFQAQPLIVEPSPAAPKAEEVSSAKPKKPSGESSNHVYRATAVHITHNDPLSAATPSHNFSNGGVNKSVVSVTANGVKGSTEMIPQPKTNQNSSQLKPPQQKIR